MDKIEFINELKNRLNKLPEQEIKNAITYYEEYFDEAGEENEEKVIQELESPANVASQIIANYAMKDSKNIENSTKKGLSVIWIVILGIFASPIALPLALAVIILALAAIIIIFSFLFAFGVTGVALILAGFIYTLLSIFLFFQHFATGLLFLGFTLISVGTGIAFLKFTTFMSKKSFGWIANIMSKFLIRRGVK